MMGFVPGIHAQRVVCVYAPSALLNKVGTGRALHSLSLPKCSSMLGLQRLRQVAAARSGLWLCPVCAAAALTFCCKQRQRKVAVQRQ
jgi:hypothetical protein